jgi:eukaryotic-like serine/threonine-protein kinase
VAVHAVAIVVGNTITAAGDGGSFAYRIGATWAGAPVPVSAPPRGDGGDSLTVMGGPGGDFVDDRRFEVRGNLGSGGMGVVYRALDRRLNREVALKVVRHASGGDLFRFKREFRAVAGIIHPNLVTLHELHTTGDSWFFTMDLVDGVPFVDWVRPPLDGSRAPGGDSGEDATITAAMPIRPLSASAPLFDLGRLRAALPQLIDGVLAVHVSGKLHRDLKPSNVLVCPDGRVVILDFGLASDVDGMGTDHTHDRAAVGTPAYMSPEQASDRALTEASDWYAVGAMLYEALTGRRPFEGSTEQLLRRKQLEVPPAPSELEPSVPPDLDTLCMQLLAIRSSDRPDGRAILAALGRTPSQATLDVERTASSGTFVGRAAELGVLRQAFTDTRRRTVTVFVGGESGIGKSQLVHRFLAEVGSDAIVLEGRCYERESVPFRTLDAVIDALTGTLMAMSHDDLRRRLPRDSAALARLFPVVRRVPAIAERAMVSAVSGGPQELRRRAFDALRALLGLLARHAPVVIAIDDLQWGDADSAVFLAELAHHPDPLAVLLVLMHRNEDNAGIVHAVQTPPEGVATGDVRTLSLGPLSEDDARLLIQTFVDGTTTGELLVREAGGHPLFLAELARSAGHRHSHAASLEELIQRRLDALPRPAVALMRTVAVAARPLPLDVAARASGLEGGSSELAVLRAERLARVRVDHADATSVEPYHDRVRHAVVAGIDAAALRAIHGALAEAYEAGGNDADREALVAHWLAAGKASRAAAHATAAAQFAEAALAFHRAADLYALALEHVSTTTPLDDTAEEDAERRSLRRRRAEALTSAGRLDEAAAAFAEAAAHAPPDEAFELDTRRLEQLLRRGQLDEGMELSRRLLAGIGIRVPASRAGAMRAVVWQLAKQIVRGLGFTERRPEDVSPDALRRVDLLYATATGLGLVEPIAGRLLQCHHLRAALEAGEIGRACSALALELPYTAEAGTGAARKVDALSARVRDLADRIGDPYVQGRATTMRGFANFLLGRWRDASLLAEAGLAQMHEHGVGVRWDFDVIEDIHLASLNFLGETREVVRLAPLRLRDAMERGDVYALGDLRGGRGNIAWLIMGKPQEARSHVEAVEIALLEPRNVQLRHFDQLSSHAQIDLYTGDPLRAWQRLEAAWPAIEASLMTRIQILRIEGAFLRARAALAAAAIAGEDERQPMLALARKLARKLAAENAGWADAFATQIRATLCMLVGERERAATLLEAAERCYAAADMRLHATVVRLRKGELERGITGSTLTGGARDDMREQAVADPDAMARLLCPWPP